MWRATLPTQILHVAKTYSHCRLPAPLYALGDVAHVVPPSFVTSDTATFHNHSGSSYMLMVRRHFSSLIPLMLTIQFLSLHLPTSNASRLLQ